MKYIRALKKQLEFTGKLVELYDISSEIPPSIVSKTDFEGNKYPKSMYSALRMVSGEALLNTKNNHIPLTQGSLYLIQSKLIQSLTSQAPVTMSVYHFTSEKVPVFFQTDQIYLIPYDRQEEQLKQMMLAPERENELAANSALHALFRLQYYSWVTAYKNKSTNHGPYEKEIRQVAERIESDPGKKISFTQLSESLNLSERNFRKMFTLIMGMSPKAYQQELRLKTAAYALRDGSVTMAEIAEDLGYYSQFQFSRDFKKRFGVTPTEYKKKS